VSRDAAIRTGRPVVVVAAASPSTPETYRVTFDGAVVSSTTHAGSSESDA